MTALLSAVLAVETKPLVRSAYWYVAHSCSLVIVYVVYAAFTGNNFLYAWAGLAIVNTVVLPFLYGGLKYTARRIPAEVQVSRLGVALLLVVALAAVLLASFGSSLTLIAAESPLDSLDESVSVNLVASLLLFSYGIIVLLTRRHLFKMALGLLIMTSGAHLTLVQMAPETFSMVEIEILTKVIGTVFAMLYAVRVLAERFHTTDAAHLLGPEE
jgi:hydrogenase-4 membrane subunit HyfE